MASPATEVSLHCVICFEEFDTRERPPVVLPCGHTYVCLVCSKRLTKCMECREPLFWTPPAPKHQQHGGALHMNGRSPLPSNRYGHARGRYSPAPHTPPHPAQNPPIKEDPIQYPIPKNTVLLGMIEAAERQKRLLGGGGGGGGGNNINPNTEKNGDHNLADELDEEDEPLVNPILAGMSALAGSCGTYAVKEPCGLAVLPFDPNMRHHSTKLGDIDKPDEEKKEADVKEPFTIEMGQTVQVVNADEGVYQLARGAGYIVATTNQLVKGKYGILSRYHYGEKSTLLPLFCLLCILWFLMRVLSHTVFWIMVFLHTTNSWRSIGTILPTGGDVTFCKKKARRASQGA